MMTHAEIQKADESSRRKLLWIVATAALCGVPVVLYLELRMNAFQAWLERGLGLLIGKPYLAALIAIALVSPVLIFSCYLFRYGRQVAAVRRFPLPGERVVRDVLVRNGATAVSYARILQFLSLLLCGASAALPVVFWRILGALHGAV